MFSLESLKQDFHQEANIGPMKKINDALHLWAYMLPRIILNTFLIENILSIAPVMPY